MHVVIAPDSFGGSLTAAEAATAIAAGWASARPQDTLALVPMADGGQGTLEVLATALSDATWHTVEVAGPRTLPVQARFLRDGDDAYVEVAEACGLHLLDTDQRDPLRTTTYGVGQLLDAVRGSGATRLHVALGGSATVDGGAGALTGLGLRLRREDGSGLKVGGGELHEIRSISHGWAADWSDTEVLLWADVIAPLADAAAVFGPQKGATPEGVAFLTAGLRTFAQVAERDLPGCDPTAAGSGAAGGLGFGLSAALTAPIVPGSATIADLVGLPAAITTADLVITGEGRLDATSATGKVIGEVLRQAALRANLPVFAVVGQERERPEGLADVEAASPGGPTPDAVQLVEAAAARLAGRLRS